jgi:hypothetical protein
MISWYSGLLIPLRNCFIKLMYYCITVQYNTQQILKLLLKEKRLSTAHHFASERSPASRDVYTVLKNNPQTVAF